MKFTQSKQKPLNNSLNLLFSLTLLLASSGGSFAKPAATKAPKPAAAKVQVKEEKKAEVVPTVIKNIVNSCSTDATIEQLISNPEKFLNKEVCFSGIFSTFSALALDYPPALRERKKYISLTLLRPNTKIPLGELKLALKIDEAQKHEALPKIAEGDSVKVKGRLFSAALGEPWLDVVQIQVTKSPSNKDDSANSAFDEI